MNRIANVWAGLVAIEQTIDPVLRVYPDRPATIELPAVYNVLLPSQTDRPDVCTINDRVRIAVNVAVRHADIDEDHPDLRALFDQTLDALDQEIANPAPFGANAARREGIASSADLFNEVPVLAWQAVLEIRVGGTFNQTR